jgi:hypothetical protein
MAFPRTKVNFDEVYDFLVSEPSPSDIIAYRALDDLQAQLEELLELNRTRQLSDEEESDLDELLRFNDFMSELKLRASQKLARS